MKCYIKDYPRPQFVRQSWENLNGMWDFAFDDENVGEQEKWYQSFDAHQQIRVPFTYECVLSGIADEKRHDNIWYHKTIQVEGAKLDDYDYILHFEGSDFVTKLWVNGQYVGVHRGGYARFSFDITNLIKDGMNELIVKVEDSFDLQQPRGKQRWIDRNYDCWYVQTTGIWKTVWTEYVPKVRISGVKMTPNLCDHSLELEADIIAPEALLNGELMLETTITFKDRLVNRNYTAFPSAHVKTSIDMFMKQTARPEWGDTLWTPEKPNLYDIEFRLVRAQEVLDIVGSYFAMREIRVVGSNILLNGRPLYQRLILDQGYWKDSHMTPPDEEALIEDIDKIHELGYNGLRKHQKTEDERFLYWCDVKGMLVWSEFPAAYQYSDYAVSEMTAEWLEIVKQNYNHPCIITWVPFNESWGISQVKRRSDQQSFTEGIYYLTKSIDRTRPVIVNDGWDHTVSDIITLHDYVVLGKKFKQRYMDHKNDILEGRISHSAKHFSLAEGYEYNGRPVIVSEYGGIAFNNDDSGWGYGEKVTSRDGFVERFDSITTAIMEIPYICGFCYTQITDVQQEVNGLMDMERNFKVNPETIKKINTKNCRY